MQAQILESKVMNWDDEGAQEGPKKQQKGVVNISKTETQPKRNDKQQKQAIMEIVVILGQLHNRPTTWL